MFCNCAVTETSKKTHQDAKILKKNCSSARRADFNFLKLQIDSVSRRVRIGRLRAFQIAANARQIASFEAIFKGDLLFKILLVSLLQTVENIAHLRMDSERFSTIWKWGKVRDSLGIYGKREQSRNSAGSPSVTFEQHVIAYFRYWHLWTRKF